MTAYLPIKTLAIIPARGASKRLPGKNVKLLGDLPLIVHSINYAKANSEIIDKIVVSTDDAEIKRIAMAQGVEVIDRPSALAQDLTSTIEVLQHVVENIEDQYENIILLQPTNPLRPQELLKLAYKEFTEGNYQSLMTVTQNHQKFGKIKDNRFVPFNYKMGERSQDLEPLYFENGLLYITKASLIMEGNIMGTNNFPFIVDHPFAHVDIDQQEDLEYAEFLLKKIELK